jgi:hypothetical protein
MCALGWRRNLRIADAPSTADAGRWHLVSVDSFRFRCYFPPAALDFDALPTQPAPLNLIQLNLIQSTYFDVIRVEFVARQSVERTEIHAVGEQSAIARSVPAFQSEKFVH